VSLSQWSQVAFWSNDSSDSSDTISRAGMANAIVSYGSAAT
jgi:hypothetical protein